MKYKYGNLSKEQISSVKKSFQKSIYFLLICIEKTCYKNTKRDNLNMIDVNDAFKNVMYRIGGFNSLLGEPIEIVHVLSLLQSALNIYNSSEFDYKICRKLILDAGAEIVRIKEDD